MDPQGFMDGLPEFSGCVQIFFVRECVCKNKQAFSFLKSSVDFLRFSMGS